MSGTAPRPIVDLSFPHRWQAEVLAARPLILPARHFVYPREAEEVERGALEVLIRPEGDDGQNISGNLRAGVSRSCCADWPMVYSETRRNLRGLREGMRT